ncbi:hypothetical protein [Paenalcaligenes sp.]|uniref:hypothetical protein n=1 Tax=Paenalcaligenes sp. TaxID=1966342 RepID=UPI00262E9C2E|nr:hypothetical protein [Paenalcaligenes sp.]
MTLPNGYFGNAPTSWQTLDTKLMSKHLADEGYEIICTDIVNLLNYDLSARDFVVYTAADNDEVNRYVLDILYFAKDRGAVLVPPYEIMQSYENKGFQCLYRKKVGIEDLDETYLFDLSSFSREYPFVYKDVMGAGSSGVELVNNKKEWAKIVNNKMRIGFIQQLKNYIRKLHLTHEQYGFYEYKYKAFKRFVTQEFVSGLDCDYRVLIFAEKYYPMKRAVRKNDFRASGSKDFSYSDIPLEVLDYALLIKQKIDSPFLSLDIAFSKKNKKCELIEYQGLSFGTSALRKSKGYYSCNNLTDGWVFFEKEPNLELSYSEALYEYVKKYE